MKTIFTSILLLFATMMVSAQEFTITFNPNGGDPNVKWTESTVNGGKVKEPAKVLKMDCNTITAWHDAGGTPWNFETSIASSDMELTAQWTPTQYEVTFNTNGSTLANMPPKSVNCGQTISTVTNPPVPTSCDQFKHWEVDNQKFDPLTDIVKKPIELKAIWEKIQYTVQFEVDGAFIADLEQSVNCGSTLNKPTKPEKEHYEFSHWEKTTLAGTEYNFNDIVSGNLDLKAVFTPKKYTVTYDYKGAAPNETVEVAYDQPIPPPTTSPTPTKECHSLDAVNKWLKDDGSPLALGTDKVKGPTTLEAQWVRDEYEVEYDFDGGDTTPASTPPVKVKYPCGDPVDGLSIPEITKQYFDFDFWELDGGPTGEAYDMKSQVTKNIKLKAIWKPKKIKISFDLDGAYTPLIEPIEVVSNNKMATTDIPDAPEKECLVFDTWEKIDNTAIDLSSYIFTEEEDVKLKAKWKLPTITSFSVKIDPKDGSTPAATTITCGDKVTEPAAPIKAGFTFEGWIIDNTADKYDFDQKVFDNVKIEAKWKAVVTDATNNVTITYDSKGGSDVPSEVLVSGTTPVKPANPTKMCHTFSHWERIAGGSPFDFVLGLVTDDITLTAVWTKNTGTIFVFLDATAIDGSTKVSPIVNCGDKVAKPKFSEIKEGHEVTWINKNNGQPYDFNAPVSDNLQLTAVWTKEVEAPIAYHNVTFDTDGGSKIKGQKVAEKNAVTKPANPTKKGHEFKEWTLFDKPYDFKTQLFYSITLKAVWTKTGTSGDQGGNQGGNDEQHSIDVEANGVFTYPNPFTDNIFVNSDAEILEIRVYQINGQCILHTTPKASGQVMLDLNALNQGLYLVKVVTTEGISTIKMIKR